MAKYILEETSECQKGYNWEAIKTDSKTFGWNETESWKGQKSFEKNRILIIEETEFVEKDIIKKD